MSKFFDWFRDKLIVGGMPNMDDWHNFKRNNIDIVINVSDEHNWNMINSAKQLDIDYFWFPLHEYSKNYDIGLNSIYAALLVMFEAEKMNRKIYLHCHVGANRSPTVEASYHFMRTGKHQNIPYKEIDPRISEMFTNTFEAQIENDKMLYDSIKDLGLQATTKVKIMYPDIEPFNPADYEYGNNRLLENIRHGFLPARPKMESFLKHCNKAFIKYFNQQEDNSTPSLEDIKINSQIN